MIRKLHPAVHVTAGFFFVILSQFCEGFALLELAGGLGLLAGIFARTHFWKVLRRLRFVALAILVLFAWQTPGTLILPALEALSPTRDGFALALPPLFRLVSVAAIVALLKEGLGPDEWVSSIHALSRPFLGLGFPGDRLAIRLRLVLEYVEERNVDWRTFLKESKRADAASPEIHCEVRPLLLVDRFVIGVLLSLTVMVPLW